MRVLPQTHIANYDDDKDDQSCEETHDDEISLVRMRM